MFKASKGGRVKIGVLAFGFLLNALASNAFARTEYAVLQMFTIVRMFEQYIDCLSTERDPLSTVRNLTIEDAKWRKIGMNNANTISKIRFTHGDTVVIENSRFGFEIHFKYKYEQDSIVWTCRIEDASIFFHPGECNGWQKRMTSHPPANREVPTERR